MSRYRGDQTAQNTLIYVEKILDVDFEDEEEELRKEEEALEYCYSHLMQKKLDWTINLQKLAKKFLDLVFRTGKHTHIKEVLKNYRGITQSQHPESLRQVLEYYCDQKLQTVLVEDIPEDKIDFICSMPDIDTDQASSAIIFSSFQPQQKNEREEIKKNLKIVWDGYKAIVDTVRVNQKLEIVYRNTLMKVFEFVEKYNRKHQFKSLCKYLREGLKLAINKRDKNEQQKGFYIDIEKDEVNTNNIEIRQEQFKVTIKLGLWQEAFQILEDINQLIRVRRGPLKSSIKTIYFENLSKVFRKSNYWHYHAYAYFNYYNIYLRKPKLTPDEKRQMADKLLLSVLCIPPSTLESRQSKESQDKICSMMITSTNIPEKKELEEIMITKGVVENASPEIKNLWYFMFLEFDITSLKKGLNLLEKVKEQYEDFIELIQNILIYKQLISIAQVYERIKYQNLLKLIPLEKQNIEKILMNCYHQKIIDFVLDQKQGIIIFQDGREQEVNPCQQLHSAFIDLAMCHEQVRKVDKNFIMMKVTDFMKNPENHYDIRDANAMEFRRKIRKMMQNQTDEEKKRQKQLKQEQEILELEKRVREEEEKKQKEQKQKLFIKKKVYINDIVQTKGQRVVRVNNKRIEDLTPQQIENIELVVFEQYLEQTKKRVESDNENRYKKKFLNIHYAERERREQLVKHIEKAIPEEQQAIMEKVIDVAFKKFKQNQNLKQRIENIDVDVKETIQRHYNQNFQQYEKNMREYKERLKDEFKKKIMNKAMDLMQQDQKKKEEEQKRLRDAQESRKSEVWAFKTVARGDDKKQDDKWARKAPTATEQKKEEKEEKPREFKPKRDQGITIGLKKNRFDDLDLGKEQEEKKVQDEQKEIKEQQKKETKQIEIGKKMPPAASQGQGKFIAAPLSTKKEEKEKMRWGGNTSKTDTSTNNKPKGKGW